jgi:hypothetical protein
MRSFLYMWGPSLLGYTDKKFALREGEEVAPWPLFTRMPTRLVLGNSR